MAAHRAGASRRTGLSPSGDRWRVWASGRPISEPLRTVARAWPNDSRPKLRLVPACAHSFRKCCFAESPDDFAQGQNMVAAFNLIAGARHVGEDFSLDRFG